MTAFLFLLPTGLRRLLFTTSTSSTTTHNHHLFRSEPWYFSDPRFKTLDLYSLLLFLPLASFSESFLFFSSSDPSLRFSFLRQSLLLLLFWLLLLLILLRDAFPSFLPLHDSLLFLFASFAFSIEYFLIATPFETSGPAPRMYHFWGNLNLVCIGSCLILSFRPTALFADVALSLGLVLKANWALQVGLSLYTEGFAPVGCGYRPPAPPGKCELDEDLSRAVALVDLLFVGHVMVVVVVFLMVFWMFGRGRSHPRSSSLSSIPMFEIE
ncbi:hypothetical protein QJS10_CPB18g01945 [Acorus calamus]|uniref:Uncharacterized protein n=1 Tax=Acorus calamus TaxID=4465 RepID=A0AAV9CR64_ACOCL|nr:hypothetical protein QJS10_CPB18g01945 [Acorus calamus]